MVASLAAASSGSARGSCKGAAHTHICMRPQQHVSRARRVRHDRSAEGCQRQAACPSRAQPDAGLQVRFSRGPCMCSGPHLPMLPSADALSQLSALHVWRGAAAGGPRSYRPLDAHKKGCAPSHARQQASPGWQPDGWVGQDCHPWPAPAGGIAQPSWQSASPGCRRRPWPGPGRAAPPASHCWGRTPPPAHSGRLEVGTTQ